MTLTDLEAAALSGHYKSRRPSTPESLAQRLAITLGEVHEAEKTLLRKIGPDFTLADPDQGGLTALETAVLRECLPSHPTASPEVVAQQMNVTVGEVFEAIKTGMAKVEDPEHVTQESLAALGLREDGFMRGNPQAIK